MLAERRKELEKLAALFSEARDEIENARESAGTTYFNEDFAEAKSCATNALDYYNQLLKELQPEEAIKLKEEQNPKMEQLKMELSMLEELAAD